MANCRLVLHGNLGCHIFREPADAFLDPVSVNRNKRRDGHVVYMNSLFSSLCPCLVQLAIPGEAVLVVSSRLS